MSTVAINLNHALHEGLAAAHIDIKQANSNVAMQTKVIQWLEAWISKGAPGTVSQRLDAARVFAAQQAGANAELTATINNRLDNLQKSFETLFASMPNSSRATLAVIPHVNLQLISTAIDGIKGEADKGSIQEMNMLMHALIDNANKHTKEAETDSKDGEFKTKLRELVSENKGSFTSDFLNQFNSTLEERKNESSIDLSLNDPHNQLDTNHKLDTAMHLLIQEQEGNPIINLGERNINKDYEAWSSLSKEDKAKAQEEAAEFFSNILNGHLEGMDAKTKQKVIQEQFNTIKDPNTQTLIRIKVQEEKTRANLAKHQDDISELFGKLFGEGFASQALATVLVGFAGGSLIGMPLLGIFLTGMISLLGRIDNTKAASKQVPPKVEGKKAAEKQFTAAM